MDFDVGFEVYQRFGVNGFFDDAKEVEGLSVLIRELFEFLAAASCLGGEAEVLDISRVHADSQCTDLARRGVFG